MDDSYLNLSGSALRISGPRDVPKLREALLRGWRDDGPYSMTAAHMSREQSHLAAVQEPVWQRYALTEASLWWITPEMCDLLLSAEQTLPDETICERELMPREHGLVVFEKPLTGIDAQSGEQIQVDAIAWAPILLGLEPKAEQIVRLHARKPHARIGPRPGIGIVSYRKLNADMGMNGEELQLAIASGAISQAMPSDWSPDERGISASLHGDIWAPLGRADWVIGRALTDDLLAGFDDQDGEPENLALRYGDGFDSVMEDRRRLAALWLLLSQPGIVQAREERAPRGERRRAQRAGLSAPDVQIIDISRAHAPATKSAEEQSEHRKLHVRFLVSGHWRRQAYGPKLAYRRPTWIAAHWRGPEDAPLSKIEHVRVFREHDDQRAEEE
jgi:hypothetical protein